MANWDFFLFAFFVFFLMVHFQKVVLQEYTDLGRHVSLERLLRNMVEFLSGAIHRAMNILILPIYSEDVLTNQPFTSLRKCPTTDLPYLVICFSCNCLNAFTSYSTVGLNLLGREKHLQPIFTSVGCTRPSSQLETPNPSSFRAYQVCPWGTVVLACSFTMRASPSCQCLSTPSFMKSSLCAPTMLLQQRMGILAHNQCFSHEKC